MKHNQAKTMLLLLSLLGLTFSFISCSASDDEQNAEETQISEEEATESLALAISPKSNGVVQLSIQASLNIEASLTVTYECNQEYTNSYQLDYNGAALSCNAAYNWAWQLNCSDNILSDCALALKGTTEYESQRMNSDGDMTATVRISNLEQSEPNYSLTMDYTLISEQVSKVRMQKSFNTTIKVNGDVSLKKENQKLTGGQVEASFTGLSSTGNTYEYSGVVVFNGDNTATLTMQSGNTYTISW
ncbi:MULTISPECIES: hypothetical protein [Zunongwangia]|jgi:hypothetical protein|uniref:hypothetical protein n=1 Tax=Zunongwangia TaxID=417127 RepID=UPI001D1810D2|nr:hypothetical protein [Zunongwangia profunda]MCC4230532.1 hypothetical protein [Zunongwangia profunda]